MEGRADLEIRVVPKKMQESGLAAMGMYCLHPILRDEDPWMISGMP
jgi:hypothetical protein